MEVSALYTYPIKSLGGITLQKAAVEARGLAYDRRWMLVDQQGKFLTQRQHPTMALLQVTLDEREETLTVYHKQQPQQTISIPLKIAQTTTRTVEVWGDYCEAQGWGKLYDEWFSDMLQFDCQLVYMPTSTKRAVETAYAKQEEITSFSDGYPFLLIGQASLDALNQRLPEAIPMNRFRPNIVFTGGEAHIEDTWQYFKINEITFQAAKPCARCVVTTIDQATATQYKEPLKTLATYRKVGNKILFGQNLLHQGSGYIHVGDKIDVLSLQEQAS